MTKVTKLSGYSRFDLLKLLEGRTNLVGIELGVASGDYSAKMLDSGKFFQFFGVDMYADTHDTEQYKLALTKVGILKNYKLLRMTFDDAIDLFPDHTFDFIYMDGYAGAGLEGGKTLRSWARKVKIGGIIARDDYHEDFPLLKEIVNEMCKQNGLTLMVTEGASDNSAYGNYPSWAVVKTSEMIGETSDKFLKEGEKSALRLDKKKSYAKKLDNLIRKIVPTERYEKLRQWNRARKRRLQLRQSK